MKRTEGSARTATVVGSHQGKVRVGVIGAGVFGGYHAQKFASSFHSEFVGVFDLNAEAAGKVVAKVGQGEVFATFEAHRRRVRRARDRNARLQPRHADAPRARSRQACSRREAPRADGR